MSLTPTLRELEVRFLHKDGTQHTLRGRRARWEETSDERLGLWGLDLVNHRARVANKVRSGDEVEFWLRKDDESSKRRVHVGVMGTLGRDFRLARMSEFELAGLSFEAVLLDRHVTKTVRTSKDVGALIHEVMGDNDLGISLAGVANPYGTTVSDMVFDYVDWHAFLTRLAGVVNARWHIDADRVLHFYAKGSVDSGIIETGATGDAFNFVEDCETVVNVIRGFGGQNKIKHAEQATQSAYTRVTGSTSIRTKVRWPREEMPLLKVWLKSVAGSSSSVEVRLEADNGAGAPSGVPLVRYIVPASDISTTGAYAAIFFQKHLLAPGVEIHIIAQGTTPEGVDVGTDASGNMTYEAYVGYPVASEVYDQASIDAYGRREGRPIRDSDITNQEELLLRLNVQLAKFKTPLHVGSFRARSRDYITAQLGSVVTVQIPELGDEYANRVLTIAERRHSFSNHQYHLDVVLADRERERTSGNLLAALLQRIEYLEASALANNANVLQLLTANDSVGLEDVTATITATAGGNQTEWDVDAWDFSVWG